MIIKIMDYNEISELKKTKIFGLKGTTKYQKNKGIMAYTKTYPCKLLELQELRENSNSFFLKGKWLL